MSPNLPRDGSPGRSAGNCLEATRRSLVPSPGPLEARWAEGTPRSSDARTSWPRRHNDLCDVRLRCQVDTARFVVTRGRFGRDGAVDNRATTYIRNPRFYMIANTFSLEALINRVMDEFAKGETRKFFKDKEKSLSILDKYWLVPKLVSESGETFDKDGQVWQSLVELARMRNEFVHSKSDRTGYFLAYSQTEWEPLNRSNSPEGWEGREGESLFQTLQIPRDPYSFLPEHVDRIDEATRKIIVELNRLLAGAVTKDSWLTQSHEEVVFPTGEKLPWGPPNLNLRS